MKPADNRILALAGLICLLAIGWAAYEFSAAARLRSSLELSQKGIAAAQARSSELKREGDRELEQSAGLKQSFGQLTRRVAVPDQPYDRYAKGRQFLTDHPEVKPMLHEYKRALAHGWPMIAGRAAGFTDEQLKQWESLFARQNGYAFMVDDIKLPDDEGTLTVDQAQISGFKAAVGADAYARYQAFMAAQGSQSMVAGIARLAETLGSPLTPDQSRALLPLLPADQQNPDWDAATQKAAAILSPAQLQAWNSEKANRLNMRAEDAYRAGATRAAQAATP